MYFEALKSGLGSISDGGVPELVPNLWAAIPSPLNLKQASSLPSPLPAHLRHRENTVFSPGFFLQENSHFHKVDQSLLWEFLELSKPSSLQEPPTFQFSTCMSPNTLSSHDPCEERCARSPQRGSSKLKGFLKAQALCLAVQHLQHC